MKNFILSIIIYILAVISIIFGIACYVGMFKDVESFTIFKCAVISLISIKIAEFIAEVDSED